VCWGGKKAKNGIEELNHKVQLCLSKSVNWVIPHTGLLQIVDPEKNNPLKGEQYYKMELDTDLLKDTALFRRKGRK
jgi:hypothetical protein